MTTRGLEQCIARRRGVYLGIARTVGTIVSAVPLLARAETEMPIGASAATNPASCTLCTLALAAAGVVLGALCTWALLRFCRCSPVARTATATISTSAQSAGISAGISEHLSQEDAADRDARHAQSIRMLGSRAAHDLRSPIAAVEAVCSLAAGLTQDQKALLGDACRRLDEIANQLGSDPARLAEPRRPAH